MFSNNSSALSLQVDEQERLRLVKSVQVYKNVKLGKLDINKNKKIKTSNQIGEVKIKKKSRLIEDEGDQLGRKKEGFVKLQKI